jgi:hypothetical protein
MTQQIKTIDYIYNDKGEVATATVVYADGTRESFSSKAKITEVQSQLKFQSKQMLMEGI